MFLELLCEIGVNGDIGVCDEDEVCGRWCLDGVRDIERRFGVLLSLLVNFLSNVLLFFFVCMLLMFLIFSLIDGINNFLYLLYCFVLYRSLVSLTLWIRRFGLILIVRLKYFLVCLIVVGLMVLYIVLIKYCINLLMCVMVCLNLVSMW